MLLCQSINLIQHIFCGTILENWGLAFDIIAHYYIAKMLHFFGGDVEMIHLQHH